MKTLCRNKSYNYACSILEANKEKYPVDHTKTINIYWTALYDKDNNLIARYNEKTGNLQVKE